jgi:uncharacterized membrane-anchored protein
MNGKSEFTPFQKYAFWGATFLIFAAINGLIAQKEQTIRLGKPVLLPTAPRDPRSLMQGDYMAFDTRMERETNWDTMRSQLAASGQVVVRLDERDAATFARVHAGEALAANEALLPYHYNGRQAQIGVGSFFFQEGEAGEFSRAAFAEYKVHGSDAVLIGLRDGNYQRLGK